MRMRVENENESSHNKIEIENEMRVFLESLAEVCTQAYFFGH